MSGRAGSVALLLLIAAAPPTSLLPEATIPPPIWEARPVEADARTVSERTYRVAPGDGLLQLAVKTGASAEAIARANGLSRPYTLRIGQTLRIPGGRYHLVRAGQSGIAIARAYGLDWARIVTANALPEPYALRAGQRILIPEPASEGSRTRAAERSAAFRLDIDDIVTGGQPALPAKPKPTRVAARPDRPLPPAVAVVPPQRLTGNGFIWPVNGTLVKRFGRGASGDRSDGIKVAVPLNTPIRATGDGVVAYAGSGIAALGGLVIMRHGSGWTSVYGHAAKLLVTRGQVVKRGQTIALSGDTGFADQPELHFELRKNRAPVDPVGLLRRN